MRFHVLCDRIGGVSEKNRRCPPTGLAETEGFEPPVALATLAFKASAFGRSATSP